MIPCVMKMLGEPMKSSFKSDVTDGAMGRGQSAAIMQTKSIFDNVEVARSLYQ